MTFILIAIASYLEICLTPDIAGCFPLFVAELILLVACYLVASEKPEIETIEQKCSPRFRANTVAEAKIISQARCDLREQYDRQADRGDFFPASRETVQTALEFAIFTSGKRGIYHCSLPHLPLLFAAFTTALCRIYQLKT